MMICFVKLIDFERFWPSIRIAIRNKYKPNDAKYWYDVLVMMESLGLDLRNPKYICSPSLEALHDSLMKKSQ